MVALAATGIAFAARHAHAQAIFTTVPTALTGMAGMQRIQTPSMP
jgi:hypothetical protein